MYVKEIFLYLTNEIYRNYLAATDWIRGWKKSNWIKKSDSKPVMNKDLMMKIDELQQKLKLKWVKKRI
jgi:ribonuclease HI